MSSLEGIKSSYKRLIKRESNISIFIGKLEIVF